jgi:hypothetical protein
MRSGIAAVTIGGSRFDKAANAKLGMAVQSTPRPRNIAKPLPLNASGEIDIDVRANTPINTIPTTISNDTAIPGIPLICSMGTR